VRVPHLDLDQTEANCRQILRRAKQRIRASRPRFEPSMRLRDDVLRQFLSVVAGGELQPLLALLTEDVVLYSDVPYCWWGASRPTEFRSSARLCSACSRSARSFGKQAGCGARTK
jgi:hypothetical protein